MEFLMRARALSAATTNVAAAPAPASNEANSSHGDTIADNFLLSSSTSYLTAAYRENRYNAKTNISTKYKHKHANIKSNTISTWILTHKHVNEQTKYNVAFTNHSRYKKYRRSEYKLSTQKIRKPIFIKTHSPVMSRPVQVRSVTSVP